MMFHRWYSINSGKGNLPTKKINGLLDISRVVKTMEDESNNVKGRQEEYRCQI